MPECWCDFLWHCLGKTKKSRIWNSLRNDSLSTPHSDNLQRTSFVFMTQVSKREASLQSNMSLQDYKLTLESIAVLCADFDTQNSPSYFLLCLISHYNHNTRCALLYSHLPVDLGHFLPRRRRSPPAIRSFDVRKLDIGEVFTNMRIFS